MSGFPFDKDINCDGVNPPRNVCKAFVHYDFPEMSGLVHSHTKKRNYLFNKIQLSRGNFLLDARAEKEDNEELSVDSTSSHLLSGYLKGRSFDHPLLEVKGQWPQEADGWSLTSFVDNAVTF